MNNKINPNIYFVLGKNKNYAIVAARNESEAIKIAAKNNPKNFDTRSKSIRRIICPHDVFYPIVLAEDRLD